MKKKPSLSKEKKKAWALCSKYIRLKYSNWKDECKCVTCETVKPIKEMQAGHAVSSRRNSILFDERGIFPQCYGCNIGRNGREADYAIFIIDNFGREVLDDLIFKRDNESKAYYASDYIDFQEHYKRKIEEIEENKRKGIHFTFGNFKY